MKKRLIEFLLILMLMFSKRKNKKEEIKNERVY